MGQQRGRVERVAIERAVALVGEQALRTAAPSRHTYEHNWLKYGVPPERLCWTLIHLIERGTLEIPRPDVRAVEQLRELANKTGGKGPRWEFIAEFIHREHRELKRAGPR